MVHSDYARLLAAIFVFTSGSASSQEIVYRLTDLGTLGGEFVYPRAMNGSGQVTGSAQTDNAVEHAFLWDGTEMLDLDSGGPQSEGIDINNAGQVAGVTQSGGAVIWNGATMQPLGSLGGDTRVALSINASGKVTGYSDLTGNERTHAFLWDGATMQDLGALGAANNSYGHAINAAGHVTGIFGPAGGDTYRAFVWDGTSMRSLGTLGGAQSFPSAINDTDRVTGYSGLGDGKGTHAFLWNGAKMRDLGTLGGKRSQGIAINVKGQVTGDADTTDGERHAFLWDGTVMRDLGTLAAGKTSQGNAVNARGQVTGTSAIEANDDGFNEVRAFVSFGGLMQALDSLVDSQDPLVADVTLVQGIDINGRGQIVAVGCDSATLGDCHGFLVTPLEYQIQFLAPATGSAWQPDDTVPVRVALVDVNGKRITDARALLMAASCRMKLSDVGARSPKTECMNYNATTHRFYLDWILGTPVRAGGLSLRVAATYKFTMPQAVTTTQLKGLRVIQP